MDVETKEMLQAIIAGMDGLEKDLMKTSRKKLEV